MIKEPKYNEESWDIPIEEFKWRIMRKTNTQEGIKAAYAAYPDARTVSQHLDRLFGPAGWEDQYEISPSGKSVVCTLKVRIDGEWISKTDVGNVSEIEPMKGGFSDAFKRAAAKLGVGRNAYDIPELWGPVENEKYKPRKAPDGRPFDEWLVERAYQALTGRLPQSESKPQSSDPEPDTEPASVAETAPTPVSSAVENPDWVRFMDTMKQLGEEAKDRVKAWWEANGDDSSRPTPDTEPALLQKVANFAISVLMETELGAAEAVEPF